MGNFAVTKITEKYLIYSLEMALRSEWIPTSVQTIKARTSEVGFRRALILNCGTEWIFPREKDLLYLPPVLFKS